MNRVEVIDLKYDYNGDFIVSLVVIADDKEMVLVDCGMTNSYDMIKDAMAKKGLDIQKLTKVIITHQDLDHMGSLAEIKRNVKGVQILASEEEAKHISGKEEFIRVQNVDKIIDSVDEAKKKELQAYKDRIKAVETVDVDVFVKNGDTFPIAGGIEIIETPGHLPGHISVLIKEKKALVTGDALAIMDGELIPSNPQFTLDMAKAKESIKNLLNYDIEELICYHGGVFNDDVKGKIENF